MITTSIRSEERFEYTRKILAAHLDGLEEEFPIIKQLRPILLCKVYNKKMLNKLFKVKLWRLNYCYNIVNKDSQTVPFVMNRSQLRVYLSLFYHSRLCILKSRQQGISTMWLVVFVDDCINYKNIKSGMISIGHGAQHDLLDRANDVYEMMEPFAKKRVAAKVRRNVTREVRFANNSVLKIANDFRGTTLFNLHISEFGEIAAKDSERAVNIMEGSVETVHEMGKVAMESTARGENEFSKIYRDAHSNIENLTDRVGWVCANVPPSATIKVSPPNLSEFSSSADSIEANQTSVDEIIEKIAAEILTADDIITDLQFERLPFSKDMFYPIFLSWVNDPNCVSKYMVPNYNIDELAKYEAKLKEKEGIILTEEQRNFWAAKHRKLGAGTFKEYPATADEAFYVSTEGTIFAEHYNNYAHFNEVLPNTISTAVKLKSGDLSKTDFHWNYDPRLPVYASFDLGIEVTAIIWYQINNKKLVILREAYTSDFSTDEWSDILYKYPEYNYERIVLPHDAMIRQKDDTGTRPYDRMTDKGHNCQISTSKKNAWDDLGLVIEIIPHMYINPTHTPVLHKAFLHYRKEHDNVRGCWLDKPRHDDHSHPMDSIRYFVKEYHGDIIKGETETQDIDLH